MFVVVCLVIFGDMEFGALRGDSRGHRGGVEDLERRRRGGVLGILPSMIFFDSLLLLVGVLGSCRILVYFCLWY